MSRQEEDYEIGVYDDPLIKAIHHVDDGRDYTRYASAVLHQSGDIPSPPTSSTGRCAEVNPDNDG